MMNTNKESKGVQLKIEETFTTALKAIFSMDQDFPYKKDGGSLDILPMFSESKEKGRDNEIGISSIQYSLRDHSLNSDCANDIIVDKVKLGVRYSLKPTFTTVLYCRASKAGEATDLADRLILLCFTLARAWLQNTCHIEFSGVSKGNTQRIDSGGESKYGAVVSFSGTLHYDVLVKNADTLSARYNDFELIQTILEEKN